LASTVEWRLVVLSPRRRVVAAASRSRAGRVERGEAMIDAGDLRVQDVAAVA
jgi:hypothetical protein